MEAILKEMSSSYDALATKLSEATVNPEEFDKLLAFVMHACVCLRTKRGVVQSLFVTVTKLDVSMNALVVRSKCLVSTNHDPLHHPVASGRYLAKPRQAWELVLGMSQRQPQKQKLGQRPRRSLSLRLPQRENPVPRKSWRLSRSRGQSFDLQFAVGTRFGRGLWGLSIGWPCVNCFRSPDMVLTFCAPAYAVD